MPGCYLIHAWVVLAFPSADGVADRVYGNRTINSPPWSPNLLCADPWKNNLFIPRSVERPPWGSAEHPPWGSNHRQQGQGPWAPPTELGGLFCSGIRRNTQQLSPYVVLGPCSKAGIVDFAKVCSAEINLDTSLLVKASLLCPQ
jgi:hypothetical protein